MYLLFRAFITEFISDETATYWYFVYRGDFRGDNIVWDAANHPLNSFLSHWMYRFFGDIKGFLRIFSVLSFVLYAWASFKLSSLYQRKSLQILSFMALTSIPYMLEYFGYMRGYGLSLGFFMAAIYYMISFGKTRQIKYVAGVALFAWLAFIANLTLLNSLFLFLFNIALIQITFRKELKIGHHALIVGIAVLLLLVTLPFILFAFELKEHGALYYSSLDGIWDMTGKTLTRYVFFADQDWIMYVYILLFIIILWFSWKALVGIGWKKWIVSRNTSFQILFFGNLVCSILLAVILKVHYPEDRTGMYLIPLFLLVVFNLIEKIKWSEYALLFFPITLLLNLSLHSSVFTPEERMTEKFHHAVNEQIDDESTLVVYKTMYANWQYLNSHEKKRSTLPLTNMNHSRFADIFVTKDDLIDYNNKELYNEHLDEFYTPIAHSPESGHTAYKRKQKAKEKLVFTSDFVNHSGKERFIEIYMDDSLQKITTGKTLRISVEGYLEVEGKKNSTYLMMTTHLMDGVNDLTNERYIPYSFELAYQGQHLANTFKHNFLLEDRKRNENGIKIYLMNRLEKDVNTLKKARIKIYELN